MPSSGSAHKQVEPFNIDSIREDLDRVEMGVSGRPRRPKVVVIVPAHNEERFIGSVVLRVRRYADAVVVVDDGSTDYTTEVARAAGAIVVRHDKNQGKGVALNTGFVKARELSPDVVVTIDADGQHTPEELAAVIAPVLNGKADIVVGSRYLQDSSDVPTHRVWGHRVFNVISNQMSGVPVTDSQSGFRAFSQRALRTISFNSSGFSVESEMQLLAREHRLRMEEVPITIQYRDKPKRNVVAHGLMVLSGILRLTGQYRPLLFFGLPGLILLMAGVLLSGRVVDIYSAHQVLAIGYAVLSGLLATLGALSLFSGIILHSVRGLLLELVHPQHEGSKRSQPFTPISVAHASHDPHRSTIHEGAADRTRLERVPPAGSGWDQE